jgi:hypothetical protein
MSLKTHDRASFRTGQTKGRGAVQGGIRAASGLKDAHKEHTTTPRFLAQLKREAVPFKEEWFQ